MVKQGKKRVSITVDSERFDNVSKLLDEKGYPLGSLSHYLNVCILKLEYYLEPQGFDAPPAFNDSFYELEVARVGVKAACELRGMKVVECEPPDEMPRKIE